MKQIDSRGEKKMNISEILNGKKSAGTIAVICIDRRLTRHGELQRWQEEIIPEYFENGSYDIKRRGGLLPLIIGNEHAQEDFLEDITLPILESSEVVEGKAYFDIIALFHSRCKAYDNLKKKNIVIRPFWNERSLQIEHGQIGGKIIHNKLLEKVRYQAWRGEMLDPEGRQIKYEKIL